MLTRYKKTQWFARLNELKTYVEKRRRLPPNDYALRVWFNEQRKNYRKSRYAMTDDDVRGAWEIFMNDNPVFFLTNEQRWYQQFEETKQYVEEKARLPPRETTRGFWAALQIANHRTRSNMHANEEIYNQWHEFQNTYPLLFVSAEERWFNNLDALIDYHTKHNRMPKSASRLGRWHLKQEKNYQDGSFLMKDPEIKHAWEVFVATVLAPSQNEEANFNINLGLLERYVETHNEKPARNSPLGGWVTEQTQKFAENKMSEANSRKWEGLITKYPHISFMSRRTQWYMNLQKVIDHLVSNDGEVKLKEGDWYHRWINTQIHNFDNHLDEMADEGIRNLWVNDFLARVEISD